VVVGATATAIAPGNNTSPLKHPQKIERGRMGGEGWELGGRLGET
jgi:hypothetical protein